MVSSKKKGSNYNDSLLYIFTAFNNKRYQLESKFVLVWKSPLKF